MVKVEIHGCVASPPTRVVMVVCELAGIPYELKRFVPLNKTPEFKKLNPAQQIPVLVDDGFTLPESNSIIRYLLNQHAINDSLYPKDLKARAAVDARLDFTNGTLWPRGINAIRPLFVGGKVTDEALQSVKDAVAVVEEFLTRNKWVAGPTMTAGDISISIMLSSLWKQYKLGLDLDPYPKVRSWLEELDKIGPIKKMNEDGLSEMETIIADVIQSQTKHD